MVGFEIVFCCRDGWRDVHVNESIPDKLKQTLGWNKNNADTWRVYHTNGVLFMGAIGAVDGVARSASSRMSMSNSGSQGSGVTSAESSLSNTSSTSDPSDPRSAP